MAKYTVRLPDEKTETLDAEKFEIRDGSLTLFDDQKPKQPIITYAEGQWLAVVDDELMETAGEGAE
jgi:hypothetical protein